MSEEAIKVAAVTDRDFVAKFGKNILKVLPNALVRSGLHADDIANIFDDTDSFEEALAQFLVCMHYRPIRHGGRCPVCSGAYKESTIEMVSREWGF
jgi:hypothetical protein